MKSIGIICEYNPFHNGHLYHLNEAKKLDPDATIILIMSGCFTQRGDCSLISKKEKTSLALKYGIDLIIELPYPFATQSADIFAKGSIKLLKELNADYLIFGSETNNIETFKKLADIQLNSREYQEYVKEFVNEGINYPTALSKALNKISNISIDKPNDILGLSYIREIMKQKAFIKPICIKRTNNYHDINLKKHYTSATSIRHALKNKEDIKSYVPNETYVSLQKQLHYIDNYFSFLKYIIITSNNLDKIQTVDEGIENRIIKYIESSKSLDELINKVKTKRYTYNKIKRMFTHILCNFTKEEAKKYKDVTYIRILGFSKKGQLYLNEIKKKTTLPIITNYSNIKDSMLNLEYRVNAVYASILNENEKVELIQEEYKCFPVKS